MTARRPGKPVGPICGAAAILVPQVQTDPSDSLRPPKFRGIWRAVGLAAPL
jgi:hypothetical protein